MQDEERLQEIIDRVIRELADAGVLKPSPTDDDALSKPMSAGRRIRPLDLEKRSLEQLAIDLPDPTTPEARRKPGVENPLDADGLRALNTSTPARVGIGRSGARYRTSNWLLFEADLAVTQDALYRDVDQGLLDDLGLFSVQTSITSGKEEYLLRPDLGRSLNDEARKQILQRCEKKPAVQVCIGDGLSAAAIEANLRKILPVLMNGCQMAHLSWGTPFFIRYCRVGVMNDISDLIQPDVLILLIGERPGLGRAESMSAYMAFRPRAGHTDADRDVICNIYDNGGTNPLEAGAYIVQTAQKMIQHQASGIKLRMIETEKGGK
jgi:ethanolamine ammonia-lyase small subunit